jgi:3'(2'), 5'-bisphosphate nucleotidase
MNNWLETAEAAARTAGAAIQAIRHDRSVTLKGDGSPVTAADQAAHNAIVTILESTGIPILSEEGEAMADSEYLWVIDPLDGTKGFITGSADYCVMIGLLERGRPSLGVVYIPETDVLYRGSPPGAERVEGPVTTPLTVGETADSPRFLASVHHYTPLMAAVSASLGATEEKRGSIGIKAALIAETEADYFFNDGRLGEWDVCAPEAILRAAGGLVTDLRGEALCYGNPSRRIAHGVLFSNGYLHETVLQAVRSAQTGLDTGDRLAN